MCGLLQFGILALWHAVSCLGEDRNRHRNRTGPRSGIETSIPPIPSPSPDTCLPSRILFRHVFPTQPPNPSHSITPHHLSFPSTRPHPPNLTHILHLDLPPAPRPQVPPQRAPKQLPQHLEAHARQRCVVAPLGKLVADEGVLGPGVLVEAEGDAGVVEGLADEGAAFGRDLHACIH